MISFLIYFMWEKYFWHEWCKLASACRCLMLKKLKDTYMRGRENLISWYPYINVWIIWILLTHPFYSSQKAWNYIRYKDRMVIFRWEHCHIFTFPFLFSPFDYWIMYTVILCLYISPMSRDFHILGWSWIYVHSNILLSNRCCV